MSENQDIRYEMESLKNKDDPVYTEIRRYVRYLINVKKYGEEKIYGDVAHWDREAVEKAIKDVERENMKPKPKRYFVSLKEPLEDNF